MKAYITSIFILLPLLLLSQDLTLSGYIQDEKEATLPSATVVILSQIDSTMAGFALTNNDGRYIVRDLDNGDYLVQVSFLGYEQYTQEVKLDGTTTDTELNPIKLSLSSAMIDEVVIEGENIPVKINKDTIVYNANAFKTQPSDVVEDLLRQMPGVEIEEDGTIIAQGEEVEKVTVDGKDFFGNDPTIATKNLPAAAIDKVEIFDKKSDKAEFSGVDDGERQKTMNLELKEEYKKGYFGTIEAGSGYEENTESSRYKSRGNVNRFSKKSQLSIIGNLNNINEQGFSSDDYFSFMSSMGALGRGRGRNGNSGIEINQGLSDGFVETAAAGINFNYDLAAKTDLNLSYFVNDISNNINSELSRQTFLDADRSFFSDELTHQNSGNTSHNLRLKLEQEISPTQDYKINGGFRIIQADARSSELSSLRSGENRVENTGDINYSSNAQQISPSGSVLYRKKLGETSPLVVTLEASINQQNSDTNADLISETDLAPSNPNEDLINLILQDQFQRDDQQAIRLDANLSKPITNNTYLELNYRRSNTSNDAATEIFDLDGANRTFNEALSTIYTRDYIFDRYGLAWQYNDEKTSITIGSNLQHSRLDGDLIDFNESISNTNVAFLPKLQYRYQASRGNNFSVRYNTSISQPTLTQLQPVTDVSDPLNLYIGNPDLEVEYKHNLRLNYIKWDQFNFSSFFGFLNITYTKDKIINQSFIDENFVQTTTPINVSDDLSMRTSLSYSRPIRSIGTKIRVRVSNTYQNAIQFINEVKNDLNRYNTNLSLSLENRDKDKYTLRASARVGYNTTFYSESTEQNQDYLSQTYTLGTRLDAVPGWSFASDFDLTHYSAQGFSDAETVPIWTASISKYFLAGDKGEFRLSAIDLLNRNLGISRTSNANYIQNESINSLGRYVMASFLYSFNSTGEQTGNVRGKMFKAMH